MTLKEAAIKPENLYCLIRGYKAAFLSIACANIKIYGMIVNAI